MLKNILFASATILAAANASAASVSITEWMYKGNGPEFVEFTNTSGATIDFSGWSYDDDGRVAGKVSLSAFGIVAAGESVILTEGDASVFRADWSLGASVKVIGGHTDNLGRNDEINLFNNSGALVDRLTFGDQNIPGSIRTENVSGNALTTATLGTNNVTLWTLSSVGDSHGSHLSLNGDIGNPGVSQVPVPAAAWLFFSGLTGLVGIARRRAA